jgi:Spy/CpxP family protein refolding chaperone
MSSLAASAAQPSQEQIMNEPNTGTPSSSTSGLRRRFFTGLAAGGVIGALLAGAASAWSHAEGPGWHGRGWCRAAAGPAEQERVAFATDWVLNRIEATPEQRDQVKAVVAGMLQDLAPLRDEHRRNRDAFLTALAQPAVEVAALDALRQAELALADRASARVIAGLAELADVLTPEQRGELIRIADQFKR